MDISPRILVTCEGPLHHELGTWHTVTSALPDSIPRSDVPGLWYFAICPECPKTGHKSAAWWPDPKEVVRWVHDVRLPVGKTKYTLFVEGPRGKQVDLEQALRVHNRVSSRPEAWQPIERFWGPDFQRLLDGTLGEEDDTA